MKKHTDQFKLDAVKDYLDGIDGFKRVAQRNGVAAPVLRRWVEWYRLHKMDGLTRKRSRYSAQFKLSVLEHMWENSLSYTKVAAIFNVRNLTSIGIWERRFQSGGIEALGPPQRSQENMKKAIRKPNPLIPDEEKTREELLADLEYLRMENVVLKKLEALAQAQKAGATKKRK